MSVLKQFIYVLIRFYVTIFLKKCIILYNFFNGFSLFVNFETFCSKATGWSIYNIPFKNWKNVFFCQKCQFCSRKAPMAH